MPHRAFGNVLDRSEPPRDLPSTLVRRTGDMVYCAITGSEVDLAGDRKRTRLRNAAGSLACSNVARCIRSRSLRHALANADRILGTDSRAVRFLEKASALAIRTNRRELSDADVRLGLCFRRASLRDSVGLCGDCFGVLAKRDGRADAPSFACWNH